MIRQRNDYTVYTIQIGSFKLPINRTDDNNGVYTQKYRYSLMLDVGLLCLYNVNGVQLGMKGIKFQIR